jgi:hypothetical protein
VKPRFEAIDVAAAVLAPQALGYGRMTEMMLVVVTGGFGASLLLFNRTAWNSLALINVPRGFVPYLGALMVAKSALTLSGLVLHARRAAANRAVRLLGSSLGCSIWIWLTWQFAANSAFGTLGFWVSVVGIFASIRIAFLTSAGLPPPMDY